LPEFTKTDWEGLYKEYSKNAEKTGALEIIRRYKKYIQKKNREIKGIRKLNGKELQQRTIIYETEEEIIDTLKAIERYLPKEKRIFYNMYQNINNKMDFGYIPIDHKNLERIIVNKEYRKKLYELLEEELSPQQFKCISLYYGAGFGQELVAQELSINQPNVNNYLKEAYNKIFNSVNIKLFIEQFN